jgi:predicted dinucleotide-binding enzyme
MKPHIGILGAGKLGVVLGQLLTRAGYTVTIAGSGDPDKIALSMRVLVPGADVATKEEVADTADIVILALPLGKYQTIPVAPLKGKLVIDAMNYWWEVDGERSEFTDDTHTSSEIVQSYLAGATVVKAISHIGYHELYDEHRPIGAPDRKAIAIAGDDEGAVARVSHIVNDLGFDPVILGNLDTGKYMQPGNALFGAHTDAQSLRKLYDEALRQK